MKYYIDGEFIGYTLPDSTCKNIDVASGKEYSVRFEKEGYQTYSVQQYVAFNEYHVHHSMLALLPTSENQIGSKGTGKGSIEITCPLNNVDIFLDGNKIRNTNTNDQFITNDLISGTHRIDAKKSGYLDWSEQEVVTADQITQVTINLRHKNSSVWIYSSPGQLDVQIDDNPVGITPFFYDGPVDVKRIRVISPPAFEPYEAPLIITDDVHNLNISLTPRAPTVIAEADVLIQKNDRFEPYFAKSLNQAAKGYLDEGNYIAAFDSATAAVKWANDVDGDGIPNEWDLMAKVANDYLYEFPLILLFIIGLAVFVDRYRCTVKPMLDVQITKDPNGRTYSLLMSLQVIHKYKSMICRISVDGRTVKIVDSPGSYVMNLGELNVGGSEVHINMTILQKRYGKVNLDWYPEEFPKRQTPIPRIIPLKTPGKTSSFNLKKVTLAILVIIVVAIAGTIFLPNSMLSKTANSESAIPSPIQAIITTSATPVPTPVSPQTTQEEQISQDSDTIPSYKQVWVQVTRDPVSRKILVEFIGATTMGIVKKMEVQITTPSGKKYSRETPINSGQASITIDDNEDRDHVQVYISFADGTRYKVKDEIVGFRNYG